MSGRKKRRSLPFPGIKQACFSASLRLLHRSIAQRLSNGNTMIDEGATGRVFEVTPRGEIVWEYRSPYSYVMPLQGRHQLPRLCRAVRLCAAAEEAGGNPGGRSGGAEFLHHAARRQRQGGGFQAEDGQAAQRAV